MKDIDFGIVKLTLNKVFNENEISLRKLASRAEMEPTQLKAYLHNEMQRVDLNVLARLCYALECDLNDILEYNPPE